MLYRYKMTVMSSIELPDYEPLHDLQKLLRSREDVANLPELLTYTNSYKLSIDDKIKQQEDGYQHYLQSKNQFDSHAARSTLSKVIEEINTNKEVSLNTQNVISGMTSSIQRLDEAKKKLVLSMTVLKRLQMLINAYQQLEILVEGKRYSEATNLLGAVAELVDHFKTYKSIDSIAELTRKVNRLKIVLTDQIFLDFEQALNGKGTISENELRSACEALDLLGQEHHDRLVNWFCNQQLKEIKNIFSSSDEAGSLENLNRRYIFFKKVLKNLEQNFINYFPESWKLEEEVTARFCAHTRESIKQLLSGSAKDTNVEILLKSLEETLEFEKYLANHFRYLANEASKSIQSSTVELNVPILKKDFNFNIASAFEPFLTIWVDHQNTFLNSKFLEFLSAPKLPEDHHEEANVVPSSADLFRAYRHLLTQCANLSTGAPLRDLSKLFSKWAIEYANKILNPTLPPSINDEEGILYVTLILNTADYCSSTITQLELKLIDTIDDEFKESIDFESAKNSFLKLINKSINLLVSKIDNECEFVWRELANTDWTHLEDVGDQSRYLASLKDILLKNTGSAFPKISRDIYIRNLCDKIVESTINQYLVGIIKTKPIPVVAAEQMLLDLSILKETFLKLPQQKAAAVSSSSQYHKHVDKLSGKLEMILKLLLTEDAPQEGLVANYLYVIGDRSVENFKKILALKGITEQNRQSKFIDLFKIHIKNHDNLVDNSPILARIDVNATQPIVPSSIGVLNSVPLPKMRSPIEGNSSPRFENILKKDNIEKGLKELALNGEAGVNKFNENFQKFGRLFNRNNHNSQS